MLNTRNSVAQAGRIRRGAGRAICAGLLMAAVLMSAGSSTASADTYVVTASSSFRYGNWGGGGYSNGKTGGIPFACSASGVPVDNLDKACMVHDQEWAAADQKYGPARAAAMTAARRNRNDARVKAVEKQWAAAYDAATAKLRLRAAELAKTPLIDYPFPLSGDSWGGWRGTTSRLVKPSHATRKLAASFIAFNLVWNAPPYTRTEYGG